MSSLSDRLRWQAERLGNKFSADDELFQLLTEAAAAIEKRTKWISVEDDLPNPQDLVLVCNKFGGVHYGYYNGYRWYTANNWLADAWTRMEDVTHWMHLPKPPEDGE